MLFRSGFIVMALIAGLFFSKKSVPFDLIGLCLATLVCYIFGVAWFMISSGATLWAALISCMLPFIAGDIIKIVVTELVVLRLRKSEDLRYEHD